MALFSAAGGKWTNKKIETRTETGNEDFAVAVGELRQDLDPGRIIIHFLIYIACQDRVSEKARTYLAWVRAMRRRQHRNGCPL